MKWKDVSSYSRGDKERVPDIWEIGDRKTVRVCVHRHIHYPKDMWLLTCLPWFDKQEIPEKDIDKAKDIALMMVAEKLRNSYLVIMKGLVDL
jgi:hypothetical protein